MLPLGCVGRNCPQLCLSWGAVHPIRRHDTPSDRVQRLVTGAVALALFVKSRVLWWLVEAASFRVVVCWFSACCGVMPPRARWGRRVLYQWTQAAVSCVGFQSGWFPSNVARNSRAHISDIEMWSLELQRLWPISKNDRVKLRATFAGVVTVVTFRSLYSPGNRDLACRCALQ